MYITTHIHNVDSNVLSPQALDKAKDAGRKERVLCKQREQAQATDQINLDLTYCVSSQVVVLVLRLSLLRMELILTVELKVCYMYLSYVPRLPVTPA